MKADAHGKKPRKSRAHAAPPPARPAAVRFLGGDPIGPLATVSDGKVSSPSRSACRSWGPSGSRWSELDAYGRPVGEVVVVGAERYDVTNCDELKVRREGGRAGAGVYVAAGAKVGATSFEPSRLGETIREDLERVVAPIERTVASFAGYEHEKKKPRPLLVFRDTRSGARYAVTGGRALVVSRWDGSRWVVEHVEKPASKKALPDAYRPRAVVDMSATGVPSIVFHELEDVGEIFGDATLVRDKDGKWTRVAPGITGSTA